MPPPSPSERLCRNPILMVVQLIDFIETDRNLKVATTNYDTVSRRERVGVRVKMDARVLSSGDWNR